jgi:hypothetical protein
MYKRRPKTLDNQEPLASLSGEGAYEYEVKIELYDQYLVETGFEWGTLRSGGVVTRIWRVTDEEREKILSWIQLVENKEAYYYLMADGFKMPIEYGISDVLEFIDDLK